MNYTYSKGDILRCARIGKRLSQNSLCRSVCSTRSLSFAENGKADLSDDVFEELMSNMGYPVNSEPCYRSKDDYKLTNRLNHILYAILNFDLKNARTALSELLNKSNIMSPESLQKWIALYNMTYVFDANFEKSIVNNLLYALTISDKGRRPDKMCNIREIEIYILLAFVLMMRNEKRSASEIVDGLRLYCSYAYSPSQHTYNHLYVYTTAILYMVDDSMDEKAEFEIIAARTYAEKNDDGLGTLIMTFILAKYYMQIGQYDRCHCEIISVIDMAEIMECPFKKVFYSWIHKNGIDKALDMPYYEQDVMMASTTPAIMDCTLINPTNYNEVWYTICDIVKDERKKRGVSTAKLSEGLCSQTKVSKLERGSQRGDAFLIHTLLQRLDIEDKYMSFFTSKKQYDAYTRMCTLNYYMHQPDFLSCHNTNDLANDRSSQLSRQLKLLYDSYHIKEVESREGILKEALVCTKPSINIKSINEELFSDAEWKCLIDLAVLSCMNGEVKKFQKYYTAINAYLSKNQGLSRFKRIYAMRELRRSFVYLRNCHMVYKIDEQLRRMEPRTSYRRYIHTVTGVLTRTD